MWLRERQKSTDVDCRGQKAPGVTSPVTPLFDSYPSPRSLWEIASLSSEIPAALIVRLRRPGVMHVLWATPTSSLLQVFGKLKRFQLQSAVEY